MTVRLAFTVLGTEVVALELGHGTEGQEQPEPGPPFGFSGSGAAQAERADDWTAEEFGQAARAGRGPR